MASTSWGQYVIRYVLANVSLSKHVAAVLSTTHSRPDWELMSRERIDWRHQWWATAYKQTITEESHEQAHYLDETWRTIARCFGRIHNLRYADWASYHPGNIQCYFLHRSRINITSAYPSATAACFTAMIQIHQMNQLNYELLRVYDKIIISVIGIIV